MHASPEHIRIISHLQYMPGDQRVTECLGLEGTFKNTQLQSPATGTVASH